MTNDPHPYSLTISHPCGICATLDDALVTHLGLGMVPDAHRAAYLTPDIHTVAGADVGGDRAEEGDKRC
jgi:hypothetical protein